MHIMWDWDEAKRESNRRKHGVDFGDVALLDWEAAVHRADVRRDYGEPRYISLGFILGRLHIVTWTPRGSQVRIINMRKANEREQEEYRRARSAH